MVFLMSVMLFGRSDMLCAQGNASDAAVGPVTTGTAGTAGSAAGGASGPPDGNGGDDAPPENDIDSPDDLNFLNVPAGTYVWPGGPGTKPIWVPKGKTYQVPYKGKLIKIKGGAFKGKFAK